ncbi:fumarylacetoacetate hydrolase family protein [Methylobacterium sp. sgz302541]|uniref:fumarylacetoacetate hydrolase family protein n=1 Tax=unclassified Methylobacterium TaxID=2615210 RepID=UPI003D336AC5
MALWIRFAQADRTGFGTLEGETVLVHEGDMFSSPQPTGERLALAGLRLLAPTRPTKMIALWNNFRALGEKLGVAAPEEPLYLLKAASSFQDPETEIRRPASYQGRIVYEGELGIVIGTRCGDASEAEAERAIFGYTCINDLTASDVLNKDPNFPQWVRAKSFDGFGPFGPAVATDLRPETLSVRTILNGQERQNYPISDMVFPAARLVSLISRDMTLEPGDVICCGTSVGVGTMKGPRDVVEIVIDGIGTLRNTLVQ